MSDIGVAQLIVDAQYFQLKKAMQTSIKRVVNVSRDGKVKKYMNKSSRDNNRQDASLQNFHRNPVA